VKPSIGEAIAVNTYPGFAGNHSGLGIYQFRFEIVKNPSGQKSQFQAAAGYLTQNGVIEMRKSWRPNDNDFTLAYGPGTDYNLARSRNVRGKNYR
jgi:hypothetical protein